MNNYNTYESQEKFVKRNLQDLKKFPSKEETRLVAQKVERRNQDPKEQTLGLGLLRFEKLLPILPERRLSRYRLYSLGANTECLRVPSPV